jgi:hypothetical protein
MPNIASILKAEISRVARKEVRTEVETLKKASAAYRASIAELRRQVGALEKELRRVAKGATRPAATAADPSDEEVATKHRFSASRLAAHRSKLGLSAASYGRRDAGDPRSLTRDFTRVVKPWPMRPFALANSGGDQGSGWPRAGLAQWLRDWPAQSAR